MMEIQIICRPHHHATIPKDTGIEKVENEALFALPQYLLLVAKPLLPFLPLLMFEDLVLSTSLSLLSTCCILYTMLYTYYTLCLR